MSISQHALAGEQHSHVVGFLGRQHCVHQPSAVHVLLWAPVVPRVLAIVEVGEHRDLEGAVCAERDAGLRWVGVQVTRECGL